MTSDRIVISKESKDVSIFLNGEPVKQDRIFNSIESIPKDFTLEGFLSKAQDKEEIIVSSVFDSGYSTSTFFEKYLQNNSQFILKDISRQGLIPKKIYLTSKLGKRFSRTVYVDPKTGQRVLKRRISEEERSIRDILRNVERDAKKQKREEESEGGSSRQVPWNIEEKVAIKEISPTITRYHRDNLVMDIVDSGVNWRIVENGKILGSANRERDAVTFVQDRFKETKK